MKPRIIKYLCAFTVFMLLASTTEKQSLKFRKIENNAFTWGEKIEFRVHYGIVHAGTGTLEILPKSEFVNDREVFHISGRGSSASKFDWFFKVRDYYDTYIDKESLAPLKFTKNIEEGTYKDIDIANFDHEKKSVKSSRSDDKISMPEYTQDIISLIYYARCLDRDKLYAGNVIPLTFYLDRQIYNISFRVLGTETINTDLGKFKTIKIRPQVVADRVFKDNDAMTLWVTDDKNLLPLRIQADLLVGSIKADISSCSNLKNPMDAWVK